MTLNIYIMKRLTLFFLTFFISAISYGQFKGIDNVVKVANKEQLAARMENEVWFQVKSTGPGIFYSMFFHSTPVDVKHAIAKTMELCSLNGFDFLKPDKDETLLPEYAKNILDYSSLSLGLKSGSCEIDKSWNDAKYILTFKMGGNAGIIVVHIKPENK